MSIQTLAPAPLDDRFPDDPSWCTGHVGGLNHGADGQPLWTLRLHEATLAEHVVQNIDGRTVVLKAVRTRLDDLGHAGDEQVEIHVGNTVLAVTPALLGQIGDLINAAREVTL